jgi:hypothetical protein
LALLHLPKPHRLQMGHGLATLTGQHSIASYITGSVAPRLCD